MATPAKTLKSHGFCLAHLKEDENKAKKGVVFPFMHGVSFRIAKGGSHAYTKFLANAYKENESVIKADSEKGEEIAVEYTRRGYAKHVLVGWDGVVDEDGNEVKYSEEAAYGYLCIDEIFDFVERKANAREYYRIKTVKELGEELKK